MLLRSAKASRWRRLIGCRIARRTWTLIAIATLVVFGVTLAFPWFKPDIFDYLKSDRFAPMGLPAGPLVIALLLHGAALTYEAIWWRAFGCLATALVGAGVALVMKEPYDDTVYRWEVLLAAKVGCVALAIAFIASLAACITRQRRMVPSDDAVTAQTVAGGQTSL